MALRGGLRQVAGWSEPTGGRSPLTLGVHIEVLCLPEFRQPSCTPSSRDPPAAPEPRSSRSSSSTATSRGRRARPAAPEELRRPLHLERRQPGLRPLAWTRRLLPLDGIEVPNRLVDDVAADPEGVAIIRALVTRDEARAVRLREGRRLMASVMHGHRLRPAPGRAVRPPPARRGLRGTAFATDPQLDSTHLHGPSPERTLLLVDDEENILSSLRRLLRRGRLHHPHRHRRPGWPSNCWPPTRWM